MNNSNISLVPLQQANLCLDCEAITAAHTTCLCCGSQALLNIARILNHRTPVRSGGPIPISLTPGRHRTASGLDSRGEYLNRERGRSIAFPLHMSENRA